jgi:hypothetical protein
LRASFCREETNNERDGSERTERISGRTRGATQASEVGRTTTCDGDDEGIATRLVEGDTATATTTATTTTTTSD